MKKKNRRGIEEFSVSFLDVICCGFGAIILLLMITKTVEPVLLEKTSTNLEGQVAAREDALFEIRGKVRELRRQLTDSQLELNNTLTQLARVNQDLTQIMGRFDLAQESKQKSRLATDQLAAAKQSLTDEMERLLAADFAPRNDLVGGIAVDSEYIIFVIDTSGSMQSNAWSMVLRKVEETLAVYPRVKGIQVMNDMGDYMFNGYRGRWLPDSPSRRESILRTLRSWSPFSNSSPVEGIQAAIESYYSPDKRIGIYVFGDDFTGNTIENVVDAVDAINARAEGGQRRVRINAVGFPVYIDRPGANTYRFAALMRELAYRNDGTFVGLTEKR